MSPLPVANASPSGCQWGQARPGPIIMIIINGSIPGQARPGGFDGNLNFNLKSRSAQAASGDRRGLPRRSRLVVEGGAAAGSAGGRLPAPLAAGTGTGTAAVWNPGPACPRAWWQGRWLLRLPPGPWGRGWRSKLWYLPVLRLAWPGASLRFEQLEGPLPQCWPRARTEPGRAARREHTAAGT